MEEIIIVILVIALFFLIKDKIIALFNPERKIKEEEKEDNGKEKKKEKRKDNSVSFYKSVHNNDIKYVYEYGSCNKETNKEYYKKEKEIDKLRLEEARKICEEISRIMANNNPSPYHGDYVVDGGKKYGKRLKIYTEFGGLGSFSYIVLDNVDVIDFVSTYFNVSLLMERGAIEEKESVLSVLW
jgi:hypothetical protein